MLWLVCIFQSQSSWVVLNPGCSDGALAKECREGICYEHRGVSRMKRLNSSNGKESSASLFGFMQSCSGHFGCVGC